MVVVGDGIAAELQTRELAHRLDIVQRLLGTGIREVVPLLEPIDPQHHGEREGPSAAARAGFGIMRRDHRFEPQPRHHAFQRGMNRRIAARLP